MSMKMLWTHLVTYNKSRFQTKYVWVVSCISNEYIELGHAQKIGIERFLPRSISEEDMCHDITITYFVGHIGGGVELGHLSNKDIMSSPIL